MSSLTHSFSAPDQRHAFTSTIASVQPPPSTCPHPTWLGAVSGYIRLQSTDMPASTCRYRTQRLPRACHQAEEIVGSTAATRVAAHLPGSPCAASVPHPPQAPPPSEDHRPMRPTVVLVHGGSFISGDKSSFDSLGRALAARGFIAASINYRLTGSGPPLVPP